MKKAILSIFCIVLIVMAIPTFVACNEKEEFVAVSVYVVDNGNLQKTPIVINKKKGELFSYNDYKEVTKATYSTQTNLYFFTDSTCKTRYDDETQLSNDISLYIDSRYLHHPKNSTCVIDFIFDGKTYSMFKDIDETLSYQDFAQTAYGKPIDVSRIWFYTDDEMQNELDIGDKPLSKLGLKIIGMLYSLSTTIYVKQV